MGVLTLTSHFPSRPTFAVVACCCHDTVTFTVVPAFAQPQSLTSVSAFAFHNCLSLETVVAGNDLKSVGTCAFAGCAALSSLVVPESLERIGWFALYDCNSLTMIVVKGSWAMCYCVDKGINYQLASYYEI